VHPNEELIRRLYDALARRDGEAMAACYAPDARFEDPVFHEMDGRRAGAMWRMLCATPGADVRVELSDVVADDTSGSAHWEAFYKFSRTGRDVHNRIDASFRFRDGLIVDHRDNFSLWRWAGMALGAQGLLLGWAPPVRRRIHAQAAGNLDRFIASSEDAGRA
jgi:ketosteroid isomerase-like protein